MIFAFKIINNIRINYKEGISYIVRNCYVLYVLKTNRFKINMMKKL